MPQGLRQREVGGHVRVAAQDRADGEEVGRRGDVVHAKDVPAGVGAVGDRRQRAGAARAASARSAHR